MSSTIHQLSDINIADPAVYERGLPHDEFRLLRDLSPVHWHPWPDRSGGFWAITRHADIVAISRDPETYSSAAEHVLLARDHPSVAEHRDARLESGTGAPLRRGHVHGRGRRDLACAIARAGNHRASEHLQPLVVPELHFRQVGAADDFVLMAGSYFQSSAHARICSTGKVNPGSSGVV